MRILSIAMLLAALATGAAALELVVEPYLQYPTRDSIIVRWETDVPATSTVVYGAKLGEDEALEGRAQTEGLHVYHEVKLTGLDAESPYFYRVISELEGNDLRVQSPVYTFSTAIEEDSPFGFVVLCDTQANPEAVHKLATLAYAQRPRFTLLGGDLVSNGEDKSHWTGHFFPNMAPLNTRVPLIPALGNHERDTPLYYDYFSLPDPEYYYRFPYGNLEIFILDSQKPFTRNGEQYGWLEEALASSTATWKIVMFHKPPYSSDNDDYGDTNETRSVHGDFNARMVTPLIEEHGVDIVWNGHIHTYERTWPIRGGKPVPEGAGPIYMITGGGGGNLENAAPERTKYTAKVYRGHHYCYVTINGNKLRIEAYDLDDRLFDWVELEK
jgi:hypothetical protein